MAIWRTWGRGCYPEVMDPEVEIEGFIAKLTDEVAGQLRAARIKMRERLPGALEIVYDNFNALAIGYGPTERSKDIIFSIAGFPLWVSRFLVGGPFLSDPKGLLKGEGSTVRHIVLKDTQVASGRSPRGVIVVRWCRQVSRYQPPSGCGCMPNASGSETNNSSPTLTR